MTTKGWLVASFLIIALILFVIVGFTIATWTGHDLLALGLASFTTAVLIHIFMGGPELKG